MNKIKLVGGPCDGEEKACVPCATVVVTRQTSLHYYRQVGTSNVYEFHRTEESKLQGREMHFIWFDEAGELK